MVERSNSCESVALDCHVSWICWPASGWSWICAAELLGANATSATNAAQRKRGCIMLPETLDAPASKDLLYPPIGKYLTGT